MCTITSTLVSNGTNSGFSGFRYCLGWWTHRAATAGASQEEQVAPDIGGWMEKIQMLVPPQQKLRAQAWDETETLACQASAVIGAFRRRGGVRRV